MDVKQCSGPCGLKKPKTDFNRKGRKSNGELRWQPYCRVCSAASSRAYYARNREQHKKVTTARTRKAYERNRAYVFDYLIAHPCIECGRTNPVTLDFDHRDPNTKDKTIAEMIKAPCSLSRLKTEIDKCDVLCASCHRIKTAKEQNWYSHRRWENQATLAKQPAT